MSALRSGAGAASVIRPHFGRAADGPGQNEELYQAAVAALELEADRIERFRRRVAETYPDSTVDIRVNPVSRYWRKGTTTNLAMCVQIRRDDGSNIGCLAGGGEDLGAALRSADAFLRDVIWRASARAFGGDERFGGWSGSVFAL